MAKLATKQTTGPVNPVSETAVERSDSQRSDTLLIDIPDSAKSLAPPSLNSNTSVAPTVSERLEITEDPASADGYASGVPKKPPKVGQIVRLDSHQYVHYVRSNGANHDWDAETSRL